MKAADFTGEKAVETVAMHQYKKTKICTGVTIALVEAVTIFKIQQAATAINSTPIKEVLTNGASKKTRAIAQTPIASNH